MPGAHREGDKRFCGASTIVTHQNSVYVNDRLWAVHGDPESHGAGNLKAIYGPKNVYINGIRVICAVGDAAERDNFGHPAPPTAPLEHSTDVIVYGGGSGGGS